MDKKLRNVIIFGIIIVSFALGYYLTIKPTPKTEFDACYDRCVKVGTSQDKGCVTICGRNYSN